MGLRSCFIMVESSWTVNWSDPSPMNRMERPRFSSLAAIAAPDKAPWKAISQYTQRPVSLRLTKTESDAAVQDLGDESGALWEGHIQDAIT